MARIRICVMEVDVEVESEELPFKELKKEAFKIFKHAKGNITGNRTIMRPLKYIFG